MTIVAREEEYDLMIRRRNYVAVFAILAASTAKGGDFSAEVEQAKSGLAPAIAQAEGLLREGKTREAHQTLLDAYPEGTRTHAQAFVLGIFLFQHNPELSRKLHELVAEKMPDEPTVQYEWALQLHRAGEFGLAADWYAKASADNPRNALIYGLRAECLLQIGKTAEAAAEWARSEAAPSGRLETFESLVCDVHRESYPNLERGDLLVKTRNGDLDAAERLIGLDCDFEIDWWNHVTRADYLEVDLAELAGAKFEDSPRLRAIRCAGLAMLSAEQEKGDVAEILRSAGFLLDEAATIPESGTMFSVMLGAAIKSKALSEADAASKFAERAFEHAKKNGGSDAYNVAAHLRLDDADKLLEIQRLAWEATGEERFASTFISSLHAKNQLSLETPELLEAQRDFPNNSLIAKCVVELTRAAGKPLQPALVAAIKAEYAGFSPSGLLFRPSSRTLRGYFVELRAALNDQ